MQGRGEVVEDRLNGTFWIVASRKASACTAGTKISMRPTVVCNCKRMCDLSSAKAKRKPRQLSSSPLPGSVAASTIPFSRRRANALVAASFNAFRISSRPVWDVTISRSSPAPSVTRMMSSVPSRFMAAVETFDTTKRATARPLLRVEESPGAPRLAFSARKCALDFSAPRYRCDVLRIQSRCPYPTLFPPSLHLMMRYTTKELEDVVPVYS